LERAAEEEEEEEEEEEVKVVRQIITENLNKMIDGRKDRSLMTIHLNISIATD